MVIYLAGGVQSLNSDMKLFLAESGGMWEAYFKESHFANAYILQSFYYADDFTERFIIPNAADFILDSGAFTFMQGNGGTTNLEEYMERYIDFIKRNKIKKYIELDVDVVTGYAAVKKNETKT